MQREKVINQLLYVPFNHDYSVDETIKRVLTEEEFFNKCFFMPDFNKEINEILSDSSEEIIAFEIDLTKDEIIERYSECFEKEKAFYEWIKTNQKDIYCIKGDAGTGKSTFLHYLKNKYPNEENNIKWKILDIKKIDAFVSALYYRINIPEFNNLYYKSIACIIQNMVEDIFIFQNDGKIDFINSAKEIEYIKRKYNILFSEYLPSEEIEKFFNKILYSKKSNNKEKCVECAKNIKVFFENLFITYNKEENKLFSICVELYICLLRCKNENLRYMLAFDNFERFIGTDEIYSSQITEFVIELRNTQNAITNNKKFLAPYYQILIFMRNTSTRMFDNQQIAELFPHNIDISDWFQISKILRKKIDWYKLNSIEVSESERILDILNDLGYCKGKFTGLRSKLNMLFNYNKRVIVRFLTKILSNILNQKYLLIYDNFKKNEMNIDSRIARFANRMIIFRLILNELRRDKFLNHITALKNNNEKTSLGYARKIFTILYEFRLQNNDEYMNFNDIISQLFNNHYNYYDENCIGTREIIAEVLYYMNYYDGRNDNWLQFIDIQYNISQKTKVRIEDYKDLRKLIDEHNQNINIKITSAGIAYLYFVVYSFEFFSCKSINSKMKCKLYGNNDLPPLLCVIPSKDDIKDNKFEDLDCIKIMKIVSTEALDCINVMNHDSNSIPFKEKVSDTPILHKNRIINSHRGFIDNFIYCLRAIYQDEITKDNDLFGKLLQLIDCIEDIRNLY